MPQTKTVLIVEDPETGDDVIFVGDTLAEAEDKADDHFGVDEDFEEFVS